MENEVSGLSSRDINENSNEYFAGSVFGSGFIAPFDPAAEKIFSPKPGCSRAYFGVTPKVAANRFE